MIEHEGIIEKIIGNHISVRILQQSSCSACSAKGLCMAAESKEKMIDIVSENSASFDANQRVVIQGKESIGLRAVFVAFVIPLIIILTALILLTSLWHLGETEVAAGAIVALVPYYIVLYLLRNKMAKSFKFTIKKIID